MPAGLPGKLQCKVHVHVLVGTLHNPVYTKAINQPTKSKMFCPLSSAAKKRNFFRRRGAVTSGSAFMAYACLLFVLALCLGATAVAPSLSIHAGWVPEPVSGFLSGPWALILMVAAMLIACAQLVSLFLSRRACGNSSCLPVTWQPTSSTRNTYQRLTNCNYISNAGRMQSSSRCAPG